MNLSVEQQFLLCCAKINWSVSAKAELQELLHRPIHWENALKIASDAGLSPLIYHTLSNIVNCDNVPQSVMQKLHKVYQANAIRNMLLYQELKKILQAADEKGIPVILLKGTALAISVYQNIALRPMGDIDLLVHQEHLELMDVIMRQFGYENNSYDTQTEKKHHQHLPRYIRHPYGVEIHWNLVHPDGPVTLDLSGMWDRARCLQIDDVKALMLAPEDLIIHLCLHASAQHLFQIRLRSLCDIAETIHYYRGEINWQKMHKRASNARIGGYIALTLTLAKKMLDIPLEENVLSGFYPKSFDNEWMECIATEIWANTKTSAQVPRDLVVIGAQKSFWAKLREMLRSIVPPRQRLYNRFKIPPYSPLIYVYYPIYIFDRLKRRGSFLLRLIYRDKVARASMARQVKIEQWLKSM